MVVNNSIERRDSGKRRRLSERRRAFSRLSNRAGQMHKLLSTGSSVSQSWSDSSQMFFGEPDNSPGASRSESPLAEKNGKVSIKIQFHIRVAPENEPLIVDPTSWTSSQPSSSSAEGSAKKRQSDGSIHERLSRQNTSSTKRRQQLLAMHNQSIKAADGSAGEQEVKPQGSIQSEDNITVSTEKEAAASSNGSKTDDELPKVGRCEQGARSSTITTGIADEATMRFLATHRDTNANLTGRAPRMSASLAARNSSIPIEPNREHIYFKRDGQRFGYEFTLKLAVDRTYRCLLKVRPLIPLQSITIQGHQIPFVDCTSRGFESSRTDASSSLMSSAPSLSRSWQNIHSSSKQNLLDQPKPDSPTQAQQMSANHRLNHAQTMANVSRTGDHPKRASELKQISQAGSRTIDQSTMKQLRQQQQSQMLRCFAASHCSSSSNSHLGHQLIYMFDWSAGHFEVNKNKVRTQVQTMLKFKDGQMLTLPLQVKFYQSESRQHLNWGSQLHFIDFDCGIDNFGNVNVDRVHYY